MYYSNIVSWLFNNATSNNTIYTALYDRMIDELGFTRKQLQTDLETIQSFA
jgi:hypothetical protein